MRLLALLPLLTVAAAQAGAPMATEDADLLGRGECESETVAGRVHGEGSGARGQSTWLGCGGRLGGQAGLAWQRSRADAGGVSDGLVLAGKLALRARSRQDSGLSLAWELAGLREPGRSQRLDSGKLLLVATRDLGGQGLLHLNLGAVRSRSSGRTLGLWALAAEWTPGGKVDALAELTGQQQGRPQLGLGLRFNPDPAWSLGLMGAQSGASGRSRSVQASLWIGF